MLIERIRGNVPGALLPNSLFPTTKIILLTMWFISIAFFWQCISVHFFFIFYYGNIQIYIKVKIV